MAEISPVKTFLSTWANPAYHVRKMREDVSAAKHGLAIWHLGTLTHNPEAFRTGVRGKMFAAFVLAGAISVIALPIGVAAQVASNKAWVGMITPMALGHLISNVAFQFIWAWTNRDLYAPHKGLVGKFMSLEEDLVPLQLAGLRVALPLVLLALPINGTFAFILDTYFQNMVKYIPIGFIMVAVEMIFFNGTYIRLMGNLFERYSEQLTRRYCGTKEST